MKIAYLLSGFARVYRDTAPLLQKNLLQLLKAKYDVDIYISTWKMTDRGGYPEWKIVPHKELQKYYEPKNILIENNWEYKNRYVSDFYRRWRAWELMNGIENMYNFQYDIVFRDRTDTVHPNIFPIRELTTIETDKVYFPKYINDHKKHPFQDWIAFGTREAMSDYFNVFNLIKDVPCQENIEILTKEIPPIPDPEYTLWAGLKYQNREWNFSSYEVTPYDRHFGNKVHEVETHENHSGDKFRLPTTIYGGAKIPEVKEKNYD